jgi:predicted nucleotidyltransferase
MVTLDRLPAILEHELAVAFPHRRLLGAWLYGSHALNRNRADSDLDIAVLFDAPLEPVATFDAAARLASVIGVSVDLVDLRRAGGLLRVEAIQGGRPLMQPTTEADFFATHALADHLSFAANRRAATAAMQEKFRAR